MNKEKQTSQLTKYGVIGNNFRLTIYALTKICMFYCMFNADWLALSGFTIATIYTYIDMMSKS
jgi:hypothetical protein